MKAVWGLLACVFMALRVGSKEIPDDDFLESINNKVEDPYNYIFSNFLKFDRGPVDDTFLSKDEMDMAHVGNTKDSPSKSRSEDETNGDSVIPEIEESRENKTDDIDTLIDGLGYLREDGSEYSSDYRDSIRDEDDDNNDDDGINREKEGGNTEKTDNTNRTEVMGIRFLPLRFDMKFPKYLYKESVGFNKGLDFFTENKHSLPDKKNDDFINTPKAVPGRSKRSVHPLFSRYEHYWTWHYPYRIYAPYHRSLDSVASGLIGKRAPASYPKDGVHPVLWK